MPITYSLTSGGIQNQVGVYNHLVDLIINLQDTFSSTCTIAGNVKGYNFTTSTFYTPVSVMSQLTFPAVPGSGSTYWQIQVDITTGTAYLQTSSVSQAAIALATTKCIIIASSSIPSGSVAPWINAITFTDFNT
jgi:hypothetical protein